MQPTTRGWPHWWWPACSAVAWWLHTFLAEAPDPIWPTWTGTRPCTGLPTRVIRHWCRCWSILGSTLKSQTILDHRHFIWCQFHQRSTYSFYSRRSQKRKRYWRLDWVLTLWGTTGVKAVCRTLMKSSPGLYFRKSNGSQTPLRQGLLIFVFYSSIFPLSNCFCCSVQTFTADHGRADWLGYWDEFVQKARLKKLACLCHIKQNNLTNLGRVCTPCFTTHLPMI